jgi:CDP-diacylglycerol--serine O-phosphatidyltransferase
MLGFAFIALDPPIVLFSLALGYALSGPVMTLFMLRQARAKRRKEPRQEGPPPPAD